MKHLSGDPLVFQIAARAGRERDVAIGEVEMGEEVVSACEHKTDRVLC